MGFTPFDKGLAWVLKIEGGYYAGEKPNDPNPTNMGVTQKTYDRWRKASGMSTKPVRSIGLDEVASIYRTLYWTKGRCERLAEKSETMSIIHFDACVNHGVASPNNQKSSGAIELFQRAVGAEDDGVFGPKTWGAFMLLLTDDGEEAVANRYLKAREAQYRYLAEKAPRTLGLNLEGWLNRLKKLRAHLKLLVAMFILLATVSGAQAQYGTKMTGSIRPRAIPIREYQRMTPLPHWHRIYFDAIQCSGAYGNVPLFKDIVWLRAPGTSFPAPPNQKNVGVGLNGIWQGGDGPPDTIVVASDMVNADWLIKHELIHYILQADHPDSKELDDELWGRACQAMRGFLPPDTTPSLPGTTTYYGDR